MKLTGDEFVKKMVAARAKKKAERAGTVAAEKPKVQAPAPFDILRDPIFGDFNTVKDIQSAVDTGKLVHWKNEGYTVTKHGGEYYITFDKGGQRENSIGLTWTDGTTLNGALSDFFIG